MSSHGDGWRGISQEMPLLHATHRFDDATTQRRSQVLDLTLDLLIHQQSATGYEAIRTPASSIASSVLTTHKSVDPGVG